MLKLIKKLIFYVLFLTSPVVYAIPNPASVYCAEKQHHLLLIQETGICVFSDNSYCEEWSYFRGECKQDQFYWPEKVIDYKNLKKYCIVRQRNKFVVTLCDQ